MKQPEAKPNYNWPDLVIDILEGKVTLDVVLQVLAACEAAAAATEEGLGGEL
jgi:hypothetical protein